MAYRSDDGGATWIELPSPYGGSFFGVLPLEPSEADDMIGGIRGAALLEGVRGEPPADRALLREVLLRLAQLAGRHPTLRELDVNPFLASPDRASACALDVRIRVGLDDRGIDRVGG